MYLLTGASELLLHRAAERLLDDLRAEGPLEVVDVRASDLGTSGAGESGLPDLRTGSLFGDRRAVLVRDAQELAAQPAATLVAELDQPTPPEATVVLLANGTGRIQKLAKRISEHGGRVDVAPPREWEDRRWASMVADELRRHGRTATPDAVTALLRHAGLDPSAVAEKAAQVAAAAPVGRIEAAHVEAVVTGLGSRGSFAVADAMCDRKPAEALTLLRGVLASGDDPVMVLGALAYRLRSIVAVAGKVDPKSVGLNVSGGQAGRLRGVRANFGPGELTAAYRTLAEADVELKGGELPPRLVIERAVVAVATKG